MTERVGIKAILALKREVICESDEHKSQHFHAADIEKGRYQDILVEYDVSDGADAKCSHLFDEYQECSSGKCYVLCYGTGDKKLAEDGIWSKVWVGRIKGHDVIQSEAMRSVGYDSYMFCVEGRTDPEV
jgi:hypothetical protein